MSSRCCSCHGRRLTLRVQAAGLVFAYPAPYGQPAPCGSWTAPCANIQDALDTAPNMTAPGPYGFPVIAAGPGEAGVRDSPHDAVSS